MSGKTELLPCPFCGGEAEAVHEISGFWTVECVECGALVDGIAAWNARAERTCEDVAIEGEWFECSECGTVKQLIHPSYCPKCGSKVVDA